MGLGICARGAGVVIDSEGPGEGSNGVNELEDVVVLLILWVSSGGTKVSLALSEVLVCRPEVTGCVGRILPALNCPSVRRSTGKSPVFLFCIAFSLSLGGIAKRVW